MIMERKSEEGDAVDMSRNAEDDDLMGDGLTGIRSRSTQDETLRGQRLTTRDYLDREKSAKSGRFKVTVP